MPESSYREIRFTDDDVVNPDDYPFIGDAHYSLKAYLIHEQGITRAVVFAASEQDALDTAADEGRLDGFEVTPEEMADYPNDEGISYLGNACKPFDIELLDIIELPRPPFSFCALFNAIPKK